MAAPILRFLLTIVPLAALLRWEPVVDRLRRPWCELLAVTLEGFNRLLGLPIRRVEASLYGQDGRGLTVLPEYDGLILLALFVAGVAAVPRQPGLAAYRRALLALGALVAINWLRLLVLLFAALYAPALFEWIHGHGAQAVMMLIVAVVFFQWLDRLGPGDQGLRSEPRGDPADA